MKEYLAEIERTNEQLVFHEPAFDFDAVIIFNVNMKVSFEKKYPNISRWVDEHCGWIEIGYNEDSPLNSFIRALDCGGMLLEGKDSYETVDEALQDLNAGLKDVLEYIYGTDNA